MWALLSLDIYSRFFPLQNIKTLNHGRYVVKHSFYFLLNIYHWLKHTISSRNTFNKYYIGLISQRNTKSKKNTIFEGITHPFPELLYQGQWTVLVLFNMHYFFSKRNNFWRFTIIIIPDLSLAKTSSPQDLHNFLVDHFIKLLVWFQIPLDLFGVSTMGRTKYTPPQPPFRISIFTPPLIKSEPSSIHGTHFNW